MHVSAVCRGRWHDDGSAEMSRGESGYIDLFTLCGHTLEDADGDPY